MNAIRAGTVMVGFALLPVTDTFSTLPDFPLTITELNVRAGYYTEGGKYLGGIPGSEHDDSFQLYECTSFNTDISASATTSATNAADTATDAAVVVSTNATVCVAWAANDLGTEVLEGGSCSCQSVANAEYCDVWSCSQLGVESTRCNCDTAGTDVDGTRKFCASWSCEEIDHGGTQEFGEYKCVSASTSADFCEAWTGIMNVSGEVEVSACKCVEQWDGASVCSYWECNERSAEKCSHANKSWCNIGVSVGVGGFIGSLGAVAVALALVAIAKEYRHSLPKNMKLVAGGFFWMLGWSTGVVIWRGLDGAVYVGIWWGAIISCGLLYYCLPTHRERITRCFATYRARIT